VSIEVATLIFLYRLGTPVALRTLTTLFGYPTGYICTMCHYVATLLVTHCAHWVRCPQSEAEWREAGRRWDEMGDSDLRGIVGAIDGVHVPIKKPQESKGEYVNRKGWHSYNVQAVCDERGLFIDVMIGSPGCMNDIGNLYLSELYRTRCHSIPAGHFIVGDGGYVLLPWLMIPYQTPQTNTVERSYYNKALSQQRVKIEQAFGRLKARWRKLLTRMDMDNQEHAQLFIASAFLLHNFCERGGADVLSAEELNAAAATHEPAQPHNDEPEWRATSTDAIKQVRESVVDAVWTNRHNRAV
jgi:hypothetical protein